RNPGRLVRCPPGFRCTSSRLRYQTAELIADQNRKKPAAVSIVSSRNGAAGPAPYGSLWL
ncbi:MAG: hypothetical protein ABW108_16445, partial [Candidatus Thiodiazotropha sp. 6PLUC10]